MARGALASDGWTRGELLLGFVVGVTGLALVFEGGALGAVTAVVVAVAWLLAGTPYAFVLGQVGLVVALGGGPETTPIAQTALLVLLLLDAALGRDAPVVAATLAVGAIATAALLVIPWTVDGVIIGGAAILAATGIAVYVVHRYERLRLGLVGEAA